MLHVKELSFSTSEGWGGGLGGRSGPHATAVSRSVVVFLSFSHFSLPLVVLLLFSVVRQTGVTFVN